MKPLYSLTSLRFFAALWVVVYHLPWDTKLLGLLYGVVGMGYAAVQFFFVLSGFILAYAYLGRSTSVHDFWIARFARIYPAYAFALVLAVPSFLDRAQSLGLGRMGCLMRTGSAIVLLQAWRPLSALDFNGPGWSISTEVLFYALFPCLLGVLSRMDNRRTQIALVAVASMGAAIGWIAYARFPSAWPFSPDVRVNEWKFFPPLHLPAFVFGVLLGRLFHERPTVPDSGRKLALLGWGAIGVLGLEVVSQPCSEA